MSSPVHEHGTHIESDLVHYLHYLYNCVINIYINQQRWCILCQINAKPHSPHRWSAQNNFRAFIFNLVLYFSNNFIYLDPAAWCMKRYWDFYETCISLSFRNIRNNISILFISLSILLPFTKTVDLGIRIGRICLLINNHIWNWKSTLSLYSQLTTDYL